MRDEYDLKGWENRNEMKDEQENSMSSMTQSFKVMWIRRMM